MRIIHPIALIIDFKIKINGKLQILELGSGIASSYHGHESLYGFGRLRGQLLNVIARAYNQKMHLIHCDEYQLRLCLNAFNSMTRIMNHNITFDAGESPPVDVLIVAADHDCDVGFVNITTAVNQFDNPVLLGDEVIGLCAIDKSMLSHMQHRLSPVEQAFFPKSALIDLNAPLPDFQELFGSLERFVIKPTHAAGGDGIIVVNSKAELLFYLENLKNCEGSVDTKTKAAYQFWKNATTAYCIVQELVEAKPITINEKDYAPTGRAVIFAKPNSGIFSSVEVVGMYWKLPPEPYGQSFNSSNVVSQIHEGSAINSAIISEDDQELIATQIKNIFPTLLNACVATNLIQEIENGDSAFTGAMLEKLLVLHKHSHSVSSRCKIDNLIRFSYLSRMLKSEFVVSKETTQTPMTALKGNTPCLIESKTDITTISHPYSNPKLIDYQLNLIQQLQNRGLSNSENEILSALISHMILFAAEKNDATLLIKIHLSALSVLPALEKTLWNDDINKFKFIYELKDEVSAMKYDEDYDVRLLNSLVSFKSPVSCFIYLVNRIINNTKLSNEDLATKQGSIIINILMQIRNRQCNGEVEMIKTKIPQNFIHACFRQILLICLVDNFFHFKYYYELKKNFDNRQEDVFDLQLLTYAADEKKDDAIFFLLNKTEENNVSLDDKFKRRIINYITTRIKYWHLSSTNYASKEDISYCVHTHTTYNSKLLEQATNEYFQTLTMQYMLETFIFNLERRSKTYLGRLFGSPELYRIKMNAAKKLLSNLNPSNQLQPLTPEELQVAADCKLISQQKSYEQRQCSLFNIMK